MSRGPGKIERVIEAEFKSAPDDIFLVEGLVALAYPGANRPEKKHRVAVIRAAGNACVRTGWGWLHQRRIGGENIYVNLNSARSYTLGKMRAAVEADGVHGVSTDELRQMVEGERDPPDRLARIIRGMEPGRVYWAHMQIHIAEAAGRYAEAAEIRSQLSALVYGRIPEIKLPDRSTAQTGEGASPSTSEYAAMPVQQQASLPPHPHNSTAA